MVETDLCRLAQKYGTDKCPQIKHPFTPFYYKLFNARRKKIKKVLELGIGYETSRYHKQEYKVGASLRMWRDFFPKAQIYGADIMTKTMFSDDRIQTFICNETKEEDLINLLKKTGSDIDIFIDDGSHNRAKQIFTAKILKPLLKKDCVYIIEDVINAEDLVAQLSEYECEVPKLPGRRHHDKLVIVK